MLLQQRCLKLVIEFMPGHATYLCIDYRSLGGSSSFLRKFVNVATSLSYLLNELSLPPKMPLLLTAHCSASLCFGASHQPPPPPTSPRFMLTTVGERRAKDNHLIFLLLPLRKKCCYDLELERERESRSSKCKSLTHITKKPLFHC